MNIQFKKGALNLCVLVLLDRQDRFGYELVQKISHRIAISEGAVYPLLRRLIKEGYFTTYLQESSEGLHENITHLLNSAGPICRNSSKNGKASRMGSIN